MRCRRSAIVLLGGMMVVSVCGGESLSAVTGFVETFSGEGRHESVDGHFGGLDNVGWEINGDGEITSDGYGFSNMGTNVEDGDSDRLVRSLQGTGSFRERIVVRNLDLGEVEFMSDSRSIGVFSLVHRLADGRDNQIAFNLTENWNTDENAWTLGVYVGSILAVQQVPRGRDVSFEIDFDDGSRIATLEYDFDIDDGNPAMTIGPIEYAGAFLDVEHMLQIDMGASGLGALAVGTLERVEVLPLSDVAGDFNGNGVLDIADMDQLSTQVRSNTNDSLYDLNADAVVNDLDRQFWVHDLKSTYFGDADLNGSFDSTDLVQVLASGEYEDGVELNSTWLTGDWDGDGDFTSGDLVVALADGGYEAGAVAVPEPAGAVLAIVAAALAVTSRRPKTRRK